MIGKHRHIGVVLALAAHCFAVSAAEFTHTEAVALKRTDWLVKGDRSCAACTFAREHGGTVPASVSVYVIVPCNGLLLSIAEALPSALWYSLPFARAPPDDVRTRSGIATPLA